MFKKEYKFNKTYESVKYHRSCLLQEQIVLILRRLLWLCILVYKGKCSNCVNNGTDYFVIIDLISFFLLYFFSDSEF